LLLRRSWDPPTPVADAWNTRAIADFDDQRVRVWHLPAMLLMRPARRHAAPAAGTFADNARPAARTQRRGFA